MQKNNCVCRTCTPYQPEYPSEHQYRSAQSYIYWNPKQRLITYKGKMSAAVALAHEMEHARINFIGGITELRNKRGYKPKEENYIVEWFEGPIARELGQPYREDYLEPYLIEKGCKK